MDTASAIATHKEPEVVVIQDAQFGSRHIHHGREIHCKPGTEEITIDPISRDLTDTRIGHDQRLTYTRTTDKDESGRVIFRLKAES